LSLTNLQIINPITYPGWDDLLLRTPGASFFHSSAWGGVLAESYGYTPLYFTILQNGKLRALVPFMEINSILTGKRGVSLPFTDYCDPVVDEGFVFKDLFDHIIEFGRKRGWKYIELRGGSSLFGVQPSVVPDSRNLTPDASRLVPFRSYLGHTLDLSQNESQIFSSFRDSTKRNIKKAIKEKVKAEISNSLESIKEFYRLNCMTRKEHGLPPQPFNFFKKIFDNVISKNLGFVILAAYDDKNVAGGVYFHFGEKAVYKYGASAMVMWEAIKWYCHNGFDHFCFGRTETEHKGLIQFKSGWGATEQEINYYRYNLEKGAFVSATSRVKGFHNKIFNKMPLPILNRIGGILYRHVG
jgi:hypothetical protein